MVSDQALNGIPKKKFFKQMESLWASKQIECEQRNWCDMGQDEFVLTQIRLVSGFYHASLVQESCLCF